MKFEVEVNANGRRAEVKVEVTTGLVSGTHTRAGKLDFVLDGQSRGADWAEVAPGIYSMILDGTSYEARALHVDQDASAGTGRFLILAGGAEFEISVRDSRTRRPKALPGANDGPQEICAPMPGRVVKVLVGENQEVVPGDGLLVIEAMKMQNELRAPRAGRVEKILVAEGAGVEAGAKLLRLV